MIQARMISGLKWRLVLNIDYFRLLEKFQSFKGTLKTPGLSVSLISREVEKQKEL